MPVLNMKAFAIYTSIIYLTFYSAISYGGAVESLNATTAQLREQANYYNQKADAAQRIADNYLSKAGRCKCSCKGFHVHFFDGCGVLELPNRCIGISILKKAEDFRSQANHYMSLASQSCESGNQISTTQNNCANHTAQNTTINSTTACSFENPANCVPKASARTTGSSLQKTSDFAGLSTMAATKETKHGVIILPDGRLQTPDGKTFKLDDIKDAKSLMSAGIPPAFAQTLIDAKKSLDEADKKAKENLQEGDKTASQKSSENGAVAAGDRSSPNQVIYGNQNSSKIDLYSDYSEETPSDPDKNPQKIDLYSDYSEETPSRGPAYDAEGDRPTLSVKYFGERIGASRENLFRMIKKRYRIKSRNDSFY